MQPPILPGVALQQIFGRGVQHVMKNWTQRDLRFCKNKASKRYKNCKKGGQQDRKSRRKLVQNASKWSNNRFLLKKIRPTLSKFISGTKCDRDKPIFSAERGGQYDCVGHKKSGSSPPCSSMGVPPSPPQRSRD